MRNFTRRSFLWVSALNPDQYAEAMASGADCVCLDLEDSVPLAQKPEAREVSLPLLAQVDNAAVERVVRINSIDTLECLRDVEAIAQCEVPPDAIMLPKVRHAEELRLLDGWLNGPLSNIALHVIIETCDGLENAYSVANWNERLVSILFGGIDMGVELRCRMSWPALVYARERVVHAAASRGIDVLDGPHLDLSNPADLEIELEHAVDLGFTGKSCIHSKQIETVHRHFTPSAAAIERARRIVDAFSESAGGLALLDGKPLEKPVLREAKRILAVAAKALGQSANMDDANEALSSPPVTVFGPMSDFDV
jgi:(S)-citramalyl-CoA lyase